jgi:hypothetical protein
MRKDSKLKKKSKENVLSGSAQKVYDWVIRRKDENFVGYDQIRI